MPSMEHESLVMLFRNRPTLATELLHDVLKLRMPLHDKVRVGSEDLTELVPDTYRADTVIVCGEPEPTLAVVVEIQRGKDPRKRWSWPMYLVSLRTRMKCPTILLIVCVESKIATWCATPIELGHPGLILTPLVIGPDLIPKVTDPQEAARAIELAALSALTHATHPGGEKIIDALVTAAAETDTTQTYNDTNYLDLVLRMLSGPARRYMEDLMKATASYRPQSDFAKRYYDQGEVKSKADDVIMVLTARGIAVTDEARERITACTDLDQLTTWIRRAVTVDTLDALFE